MQRERESPSPSLDMARMFAFEEQHSTFILFALTISSDVILPQPRLFIHARVSWRFACVLYASNIDSHHPLFLSAISRYLPLFDFAHDSAIRRGRAKRHSRLLRRIPDGDASYCARMQANVIFPPFSLSSPTLCTYANICSTG